MLAAHSGNAYSHATRSRDAHGPRIRRMLRPIQEMHIRMLRPSARPHRARTHAASGVQLPVNDSVHVVFMATSENPRARPYEGSSINKYLHGQSRDKGIKSHHFTSHHSTSDHITSHHTTRSSAPQGRGPTGRTSHRITSHHITSRHITSRHITSHHITSRHITSHHITSHHITPHHITPHHITSRHITS